MLRAGGCQVGLLVLDFVGKEAEQPIKRDRPRLFGMGNYAVFTEKPQGAGRLLRTDFENPRPLFRGGVGDVGGCRVSGQGDEGK